jgi:cytochrome c peroxidase
MGLILVPYFPPMRCVVLGLFLLCAPLGAAELRLEVQLRWQGAPVGVPSGALAGAAGQTVRLTRFAALMSGVALVRADGGTVQLDGQYGFLEAEAGRLAVTLRNVPDGDYHGLEFELGLPAVVNHGDPGQWPARHPLNPIVNGLHWGWAGGYVFAAIEWRWRAAGAEVAKEDRGFSYHLATDARVMRVGFAALIKVAGPTTVSLALDLGKAVGGHGLAADDGSETTHSAEEDALATTLTQAMARSWFFLEAKPTAGGGERAQAERPAHRLAGARRHEGGLTPLPFVVPAGFPQPELPADNPLTQEGVALGELLFNDRRLSAGSRQSCASCHAPERAFSDGQATSAGVDGLRGPRNSMPLFNLAWSPAYAWDGGKPRIRDQVRAAMTNPIEMKADLAVVVAALNRDAGLRGKFAAEFGSPEITADRVDLAIEQFLLTLVAADSKFDRSLRGTEHLTEEEKQGFALFVTEYDPARGRRGADCFHCHGGALFTDFGLRSNGLDVASADAGRALVTGKPTDAGKFKTPSLRNVAVTAPYMHDGRFGSLEEVVAHYDHGVKRAPTLDPNLAKHPDAGLALTPAEQRALVAFLRTLTDSSATVFPGDTSRTTFP